MRYKVLASTLLMALPIGAYAQAPGAPTSGDPPKPTTKAANHTITVTFQNATCTTAKPCTAQIYRANSACPSGGSIIGPSWGMLTGNLPAATVTATLSSWSYTDTTAINGLTYCVYATNTFANPPDNAEGPGGPSNTFQVQTPGPPASPNGLTLTVN